MATINEQIHEIISSIQISEEEVEDAISKHTQLRDEIAKSLDAKTSLTGSYKRRTGVKPLNDVDIFLWLPKDIAKVETLEQLKNTEPRALLERLKRRIKKLDIDHEIIRVQDHSLGIKYSNEDFGIDLIPAFSAMDPNEGDNFNRKFWIPERENQQWIPSYPEKHRILLIKANEDGNKKVIPLIKLLKDWRNQQGKNTFKSFHLESFCVYLALEHKDIFQKGKNVFQVFLEAIDQISQLLDKKVNIASALDLSQNPGAYLNDDESRYQRCLRKTKSLKRKLREVNRLNNQGKHQQASNLLKEIYSKQSISSTRRYTRVKPEAKNARFG